MTVGDAATQKSAQTYTVGSDIPSQQNGIVYANPNTLVSVSLSGVLNLFDTRESSATKWRTLQGPTKAITSSVLVDDKEKTFYTGSFDGGVKAFDVGGSEEGLCHDVSGTGHSALVQSMTQDGQGKVWSAGWDDKVASIESKEFASVRTVGDITN